MMSCWRGVVYRMIVVGGVLAAPVFGAETLEFAAARESALARGAAWVLESPALEAGATYAVNVGLLTGGLGADESLDAVLEAPDIGAFSKRLHAGDPSFYLPFRPDTGGTASISVTRNDAGSERPVQVHAQLVRLGGPQEAARFAAAPNDSPERANPLQIGLTVEGSADDIEYLDHQEEGRAGLDWFRFEIEETCLVLFELDIPDRDVSVNIRAYRPHPEAASGVVLYEVGKDPMEVIHDREPERYSKMISRVFEPGTYYLEVNANHPRYQLRTHKYPVPPYDDPELAIEVGLRYIMDIGDAWFAQIPREGNIYRRVENMHETAMRCTACHPSVFATEPNFMAHRNGYAIPSKVNFRYVIERIYNSIAPFYGPDELYWQRFIAIPLQSHGKQGGALMDFERQISGRETPIVERFGPLPRMAWLDRDVLPDDEANGVVPADSAFGFAWRDWRVLEDVHRRTGEPSYRDAADNIERIVASEETYARVENLQDRMHLVLALNYFGRDYYRERIDAEIETLFALQNEDGGWHEEGEPGGASAVYATGQMLHTLMETGLRPEKDPRIARGLEWLLTQQQDFGAWFQPTTHENFRTPMRESRYALIALAQGYPKGAPLQGLGNLDGGQARVPDLDTPPGEAMLLLENIMEAPGGEQAALAAAAIPFLERPEPPVRAAAASLLGRIGREESVGPLLPLLGDPSKLVWREAAWALRQLGNRGHAVDALRAALTSDDVLIRRGAARAFAYQFQEMDRHLDIPRSFMALAGDPDLLTRLQALRTLRQWWYRSDDMDLRAEIIATFIERMGAPGEHPIIRTNLAQNMYILMDENQTGGVSMQRNIRDFPPERAEAVLEGRRWVEEHILLKPVLTAIAEGSPLQREALLESFDGSFFKGRTYARYPYNQIDVGNDREFSFMYEPDEDLLLGTIGALIQDEPRPAQRRRGIQLSSFFRMPVHIAEPALTSALLENMRADDEALRDTAREVVREDLVLHAPDDAGIVHALTAAIHGAEPELRAAVLQAISRSPGALRQVPVRSTLHELADRLTFTGEPSADLLPFVDTDLLRDAQALDVLALSWEALREAPASARIPVVEMLAKRAWQAEPGEQSLSILQQAATDRDTAVRERVFAVLPEFDALRRGPEAVPILYAGLSDESPAIRVQALQFARENDAVWEQIDVHEYVLRLLLDADPRIRRAALEAVAERRLLEVEARYAPRLKAVMDGDEELREQAETALQLAGYVPADVHADAAIAALRQPDLLYFRDRVNHLFYVQGADANACASCHATHTILGLAEAPRDGRPLSDDDVIANYRSMLRVINTVDPEESLVLRKPRSPFGTGNAAADSPTGITHVGGIRWEEDTADEAYQTILAFIRTAQDPPPEAALTVSASSYSPDHPPALVADSDPETYWHTEFIGAMPGHPHDLVIALDSPRSIAGVICTPRADDDEGRVRDYEIYLSDDGETWGEPVATGAWPNDPQAKTVFLDPQTAQYLRIRGLSEVKDKPYMSMATVELLYPRE